jgi:hypothetical protein
VNIQIASGSTLLRIWKNQEALPAHFQLASDTNLDVSFKE